MPRTPSRKSESSSSSKVQRPRGAKAKLMPKPREVGAAQEAAEAKAPSGIVGLPPTIMPRSAAEAQAHSGIVGTAPKRIPRKAARGEPPDLPEGAWIRVKAGWLAGFAQPRSKEELYSWGADVVVSLSHLHGRRRAHGIVEAAVSASTLKDHLVCPISPVCEGDYTAEDCTGFACFVVWADFHLSQGHRVAVHCKQGLLRTGVAIYLLLRWIRMDIEECLSIMEKMRPEMYEEFLRNSPCRYLHDKAECIFNDSRFKAAVDGT